VTIGSRRGVTVRVCTSGVDVKGAAGRSCICSWGGLPRASRGPARRRLYLSAASGGGCAQHGVAMEGFEAGVSSGAAHGTIVR
jgi:hypothetical protein